VTAQVKSQGHIRPFNKHRDLMDVADLIESCFAQTLDADGRSFVRRLRSMGSTQQTLGIATRAVGLSLPLEGFVWEQDRKVIGNLSLIPVRAMGQKAFLIANVAVHMDARRQGIARAMTDTALAHLRERGIHTTYLQVRADNLPAQQLYANVGFQTFAERTTWHLPPFSIPESAPRLPPGVKVTHRRRSDWQIQKKWIDLVYPPEIRWHLPISLRLLSSGLRGTLTRMFSDARVRQRALRKNGELLAVLAWQSSYTQAHRLWLAVPHVHESQAIRQLIPYTVLPLASRKAIALNYPAGHAEKDLIAIGFRPHQTLIWKELVL
jgi:ribosomal protein S18 acetylase RimI-like enzyme